MWEKILYAVLMLLGVPVATEAVDPANGSLIYTENGSCLVSAYTKSSYSHVAIVLYEQDEPVVFEAKPGGVTKQKYRIFIQQAATAKVNGGKTVRLWISNPRIPYSKQETTRMLTLANSKLGTPYSILPTLVGKSMNTQQCAQYVSTVLESTPRFWFKDTKYQTPTTLLQIARPGYSPLSLIYENKRANNKNWQDYLRFWDK